MLSALFLCVLLVAAENSYPNERIVFQDDFNTLNPEIWEHEITMSGGGNWEFEYYINNRSNTYVKNSILYLKPTLTADTTGPIESEELNLWGSQPDVSCTDNSFYGCDRTGGAGGNDLNPIQSARLRTLKSFNFQYGRVEFVAKMPRGDWLWPALWLLPAHGKYGLWPASGEIDVIESRGNVNHPEGVQYVSSTLNWAPHYFYRTRAWTLTHSIKKADTGDWATSFHTFGLFWNESVIYTYVDTESNRILTVDMNETFFQRGQFPAGSYNPWTSGGIDAPFDQPMYLIMNVACGGTGGYWKDGVGNKPWSDTDQHAVNAFYAAKAAWYSSWKGEDAALQVDKVTVWQNTEAIERARKRFASYFPQM